MNSIASSSPRWSALFFLAGANDLGYSMERSLEELAQSKLPENVDVFVQSHDVNGEAVRFRLRHDDQGKVVRDGVQSAPSNAGDPASLESFVSYAKGEAPDNATFLIAGGHGEGHRGVALDDIHKDRLELPELEAALAPNPVDALLFDSCLMGSLEVAQALQGEASVVVASSDVVRSGTPLLGYLEAAAASRDARELGAQLVKSRASGFSTLTAVDTEALSGVAKPLSRLAQGLLDVDPALVSSLHEASRRGLEGTGNIMMGWFTYPGQRVDLGDFCGNLAATESVSEDLRKAATETREALSTATLAHSSRDASDQATGLTLSLPLYRAESGAQPEDVALWKATGWDKVIAKFQVQDAKKAGAPDIGTLMRNSLKR